MEGISPIETDKAIQRLVGKGLRAIRANNLNGVLEVQNSLQKIGAYHFSEALIETFQDAYHQWEELERQKDADYKDAVGASQYGF